ncbi:hypothetical protein GALMADRAFT_252483 [Galerina marginata CBS 339.88]|uniref:Uncharacterized protein n=1 Tax=Galerina marginata (strain CBS 339.88) TaxID=685588 RepID=A0A067SQ98_GALM3|nr:hypothetical protein GALMADRAFT_252483 [Galerina marginata CBS 339.88]
MRNRKQHHSTLSPPRAPLLAPSGASELVGGLSNTNGAVLIAIFGSSAFGVWCSLLFLLVVVALDLAECERRKADSEPKTAPLDRTQYIASPHEPAF